MVDLTPGKIVSRRPDISLILTREVSGGVFPLVAGVGLTPLAMP